MKLNHFIIYKSNVEIFYVDKKYKMESSDKFLTSIHIDDDFGIKYYNVINYVLKYEKIIFNISEINKNE